MDKTYLREADRLEITVLIDNYTDIFMSENKDVDKRTGPSKSLLAEHGLSCLIKVYSGSEEYCILMDTGMSSKCFFHNINELDIDINKIDSVILSHGHFDHIGRLTEFFNQVSTDIPLVLHPQAFIKRRLNNPSVGPSYVPILNEKDLKNAGAKIIKSEGQYLLTSNLVLLTGEVERTTIFETGFPRAEAKINDVWIVDPFKDDQGVIIKLKDKGLVVISGCAHAGIINTINYSRKITQTDKVHAVLGGFHLSGPLFEQIIPQTIDEMKKIKPDYLVPMHCTGWNAINQFKKEMPCNVIINTIGTTYIFE